MPLPSRLSPVDPTPRWALALRPFCREAVIGAALLGVLAGCRTPTPEQAADGDDPLAALATPVGSNRYSAAYWTEQFRADAAGRRAPWRQALAYCGTGDPPRPGLEADGAKPNCAAVYQAYVRTPAAEAAQRARERAALAKLQRGFDSTLQAAQERNRRLGF